MLRLLTVLFVAMLAAPATAQESEMNPRHIKLLSECVDTARQAQTPLTDCIGKASDACQDEPGGSTTIGITECLLNEAQWWDALLNDNYSALIGTLDDDRTETLRQAQRAWIDFRDAECAFHYDLWREGTIRSIMGASCTLDLTARRAADIGGMI